VDTVHECDGQTDRITITKTVQRIASHGKNGLYNFTCVYVVTSILHIMKMITSENVRILVRLQARSPGLHGLPTRSHVKCEFLIDLSMWAFVRILYRIARTSETLNHQLCTLIQFGLPFHHAMMP